MRDDQKDNEQIEDISRQALSQSTNELSADLQAKLAAARSAAINEASNRAPAYWTWGGLASACLVVAVFISINQSGSVDHSLPLAASAESDLFLLSELEDEDMAIVEELEFAFWLSQNEELSDDQNDISRG